MEPSAKEFTGSRAARGCRSMGSASEGNVVSAAEPHPLEIRRARWRDVREISELYRRQDPTDRRFFHPMPFTPVRLNILLRTAIGTAPLVRHLVRRLPRAAVLFLTGAIPNGGPVVGLGIMRFRRGADGVLVVDTGYLVDPRFRRRGYGRAIKVAMLDEGCRLGARRAETIILVDNVASQRLNLSLGFSLAPDPVRDAHFSDGQYLRGRLDLTAWDPARRAGPGAGDRTTV